MDSTASWSNVAVAVEAEQVRLRLPSRPDWIETTAEFLKHRAVLAGVCTEPQAPRLVMALHEALSNAVVHGNLEVSSDLKERDDLSFAETLAARAADPRYAARTVEVVIDYDGTRCQWAVTDQGPGFDVEAVLSRNGDDEAALLRPSGRGILMMRSLMDDVRFEAGGRRVVLTLRKPGAEKRRHARLPVHRELRLAPVRADGSVDWDAAYAGVSRNLSPEGMTVLQSQLAATDRIVIAVPGEDEPLYVPAEVRHCRTVAPGVVEIGCRFQVGPGPATPVPKPTAAVREAVGGLIERLRQQTGPDPDRRGNARVAYTERVTVLGGPGAEPLTGFARDLSKGGIAFISPAPLPLEVRTLALPQRGQPPLRVQARIVRCAKIVEGFYDVGARFVDLEA